MNATTLLPDVQSRVDSRNLAIDKVGVTQLPFSFCFASTSDNQALPQNTVGSVDLFVSLPPQHKGTHMSRFIALLERRLAADQPALEKAQDEEID